MTNNTNTTATANVVDLLGRMTTIGRNAAENAVRTTGDYKESRAIARDLISAGWAAKRICDELANEFVYGILSACQRKAGQSVADWSGIPATREGKAAIRTAAANAARGIGSALGSEWKVKASCSIRVAREGEAATWVSTLVATIAGRPAIVDISFPCERVEEARLEAVPNPELDAAANAVAAAIEGYPNSPAARVTGPAPREVQRVATRFVGNWEALAAFRKEIERDQQRLLRRAFRRGFKSGKIASKVRVN